MSPEKAEKRQRLFFALWPDEELRSALDQSAKQLLGKRVRRVAADNLHITLAFAGACTADQRACLETAAGEIQAPRFELCIDRLGYWQKPRTLWAGCHHTPMEIRTLAGALQAVLAGCGFTPDARAYVPHVTLARKQNTAPDSNKFPAITWSISEFCLVESVTDPAGARYRVLCRWALGGG